jgi:hypothetical protein
MTELGRRLWLHARSIGDMASRVLASRHSGFINGIYNNAMNLSFGKRIIGILGSSCERGPMNIVLSSTCGATHFFSFGFQVGGVVKLHGRELKLSENVSISLDSADIYKSESNLRRPIQKTEDIESNARVAAEVAMKFGKNDGLGELMRLIPWEIREENQRPPRNPNIFVSWALPRVLKLKEALLSMNETVLSSAVEELIGLGPGLTPSGDDMLAGFSLLISLYSKTAKGDLPQARILRKSILKASGRTTRLSSELLRQAVFARGNESARELCEAVLSEDTSSVRHCTRSVLKIGETSGTDIVLGVVLGASCCRSTFGDSAEKMDFLEV